MSCCRVHVLRLAFTVLCAVGLTVACADAIPREDTPPGTIPRPTAAADVAALLAEAKDALKAGNAALAVEKLQQALLLDPASAEAHYLLGNAYAQQEQFAQAEEHYQAALSTDPAHVDARSNLGVALYRQGNLENAEEAFRAALAQEPNDAEIHYNLGGVLAAENRLDEAIGEFIRANEIEPALAEPYLGLGTVYKLQGKRTEAVAALQEYLKRSQDPQWRSQAEQMLQELGAQP